MANLAAPQNNGGTEVGGGAILASEGKKKVVSEVGGWKLKARKRKKENILDWTTLESFFQLQVRLFGCCPHMLKVRAEWKKILDKIANEQAAATTS